MLHLKKSLGQHFLKDENIQRKIADAIGDLKAYARVIEIGPGLGALTKHLIKGKPDNLYLIELDDRWAEHQKTTNPWMADRVVHEDFLRTDSIYHYRPQGYDHGDDGDVSEGSRPTYRRKARQ